MYCILLLNSLTIDYLNMHQLFLMNFRVLAVDPMALIQCMSSTPGQLPRLEMLDRQICNHEEDDSGCECGLEELDGMDAWSKTVLAIRVLTTFKRKRRNKIEEERLRKEKRKTLWRRLALKMRIFNMFAKKISREQRFIKLKRKLGKFYWIRAYLHTFRLVLSFMQDGFLFLQVM